MIVGSVNMFARNKELRSVATLVVMDEGQMIPRGQACALLAAFPKITKLVVIGDIDQLEPYTLLRDEDLQIRDLGENSFLRHVMIKGTAKMCSLNRIYRNHPTIVDVLRVMRTRAQGAKAMMGPNDSLVLTIPPPVAKDYAIVMIESPGDHVFDASGMLHNPKQRELAMRLVKMYERQEQLSLIKAGSNTILVVCFYTKDAAYMKEAVKGSSLGKRIRVVTSDAASGASAKVSIVITGRTSLRSTADDDETDDHVRNVGRAYVSWSRGKERQYIIAKTDFLTAREGATKNAVRRYVEFAPIVTQEIMTIWENWTEKVSKDGGAMVQRATTSGVLMFNKEDESCDAMNISHVSSCAANINGGWRNLRIYAGDEVGEDYKPPDEVAYPTDRSGRNRGWEK